MRRLKRFIAAAILASTIFLTASFGKESAPPDEPPEEVETVTPVAYDDTYEIAELAELAKRKRADVAELARAKAEAERRASVEAVRVAEIRRKALAQKVASKPTKQPSRSNAYVGKAQAFQATAYTAKCSGCSGITKTGVDIRETIYFQGNRVIAVDPRIIPLGSVVQVELGDGTVFKATAQDTGSAIKGKIIDIAHDTKAGALNFGRQSVEIRIIEKGG